MSQERFKLIPAVYLLLRDGEKILLLRRFNTGYMDGKYSVPAGHMDGDELATKAMIREAYEEVGIALQKEDLELVHVAHRLSRGEVSQERVDFFFQANIWQGEIANKEPEKSDDVSWFPVGQLPPEMLPFVARVIQLVEQKVFYSEYETEPS